MRSLSLLAFLIPSLYATSVDAAVYRWYDDKGQLHLTQSPPPPHARRAEPDDKKGTVSIYGAEWTDSMKREAKAFMNRARVRRVWIDRDGNEVPGWY